MKITHSKEWQFDSIPYFSTESPSTSTACTNKGQVCMPFGAMVCPSHIAKFSLSESHHQSQTLCHRLHPSGIQVGGNLKVLDQGFRVMSLKTCLQPCIVMLKQDFYWILLAKLICSTSWFLSVSWCGQHQSWSSPLLAPHPRATPIHSPRRQWSWPCLALWQRHFEFFLPGRLRTVPFHRLTFLSQVPNNWPKFHLL